MEFVFRSFSPSDEISPAAGEVHIRPLSAKDQVRRAMARLLLESGLDALPRGEGTVDRIVIPADPTFDDMLASMIAHRLLTDQDVPEGLKAFATYAAILREGYRPGQVSLENSLEGIYLAIRNDSNDFTCSVDLTDPAAARRFVAAWMRMAVRVEEASRADLDPSWVPLFEGPEFLYERTILAKDHERYRHDVLRGERWWVRLPDCPTHRAGLLLRKPRSLLFKYWSREDAEAPGGEGYLFLATYDVEDNRELGRTVRWVFSTDPSISLSIKGLAERLQAAEAAIDPIHAAQDPWYDGRRHQFTIVASPRAGSLLEEEEVLEIVKRWSHARVIRSCRRALIGGVASGIACLILGAGILVWSEGKPRNRGLESIEQDEVGVLPSTPTVGTLRVLTVGISKYRDSSYNLPCARKDAESLHALFSRLSGQGLFQKVNCYDPLIDEKATRSEILRKLNSLKREATQHDLVFVALSGHGQKDADDNFFFIPYDYEAGDNEDGLAYSGVAWDDLLRPLANMPCPVVLVMDACYSGTITLAHYRGPVRKEHLRDELDHALGKHKDNPKGLVVMAASLARQSALERPEWGHGALSLALLEGLSGRRLYTARAATHLPQEGDRDGRVSLKELDFYISQRVQELAGERQAAVTNQTGNIDLEHIFIATVGTNH